MKKFSNSSAWIIFRKILSFSSCSTKEGDFSEERRFEEIASRVTIVRDSFGVPHIYGESDADTIFGMLYAQCEDDFNRVEQNYIWATGGHSASAGHGNLYNESYTAFMERDVKDIFGSIGIDFHGRHMW